MALTDLFGIPSYEDSFTFGTPNPMMGSPVMPGSGFPMGSEIARTRGLEGLLPRAGGGMPGILPTTQHFAQMAPMMQPVGQQQGFTTEMGSISPVSEQDMLLRHMFGQLGAHMPPGYQFPGQTDVGAPDDISMRIRRMFGGK